ncbi:enoyl-CoA hydratase/isomerase family protein [Acidiferrimicrobium sp. IK]|uniref:enoyl-CoA hydratase-related protein n=1 Tax=Acidiferrimicrobium sp. IK TaxID=2871700 RepID=UPI0021CB36F0|nr:enoyl-CoA hydratase-related protein [Acidiferrimicrobium sp. IK]MCU4183459.1 enoyl-CoA hydratase/isomerase family protein [Acidiferrimicrobium sp. IK]
MDLEVWNDSGVVVARINRPEARNAMTQAVIAGIGRTMREADADRDVRAVVLTATGDRAFCAGMDLRGFVAGHDGAESTEDLASFGRWQRQGITKPVIGAANGTAVAGGFELLLACDIVVAAEGARFGLPEVKRGLLAAGGGVLLSARIPIAVAYELTLTGELIDGERALALGLVNRIVPSGAVLNEALVIARQIAANGPLAVAATKRLTRAAAERPAAEVWALQDDLAPAVFASEDAKEGATAFVERRPAVWKGR